MPLDRALIPVLVSALRQQEPSIRVADVRGSSDLYLERTAPGVIPAHFGLARTQATLGPVFQAVADRVWQGFTVLAQFRSLSPDAHDLWYSTVQSLATRIASLLEITLRSLGADTAAWAAGKDPAQVRPATKLKIADPAERVLFIQRLEGKLKNQIGEEFGSLSGPEILKLRGAQTYGDVVAVLVPKYAKAIQESL